MPVFYISKFSNPQILKSIPQRLPRLQRKLNSLHCFFGGDEGEECFALEVEEVLLADGLRGGEVAAAHDEGEFFGYEFVVGADVTASEHGIDAGVKCAERGATEHCDVGALRGHGVAGMAEGKHGIFCFGDEAALIEHDVVATVF